jgi:hypothetical protein
MPVVLFLTSGGQRTVEAADSARLDGPFFMVNRKDPTTGRIDTVLTLRSADVIAAEILIDGVRVDYVLGEGNARSGDR